MKAISILDLAVIRDTLRVSLSIAAGAPFNFQGATRAETLQRLQNYLDSLTIDSLVVVEKDGTIKDLDE